jgi:ABC-2 type transport system permease protein
MLAAMTLFWRVVAINIGLPDASAIAALGRLLALTLLTALLALPAAWLATLGRGLLPGIATTVATLVAAQVMVVAGTGAWFPPAAPALWALTPDTVTPAQLSLVPAVSAAFVVLTTQAWAELQLDR